MNYDVKVIRIRYRLDKNIVILLCKRIIDLQKNLYYISISGESYPKWNL